MSHQMTWYILAHMPYFRRPGHLFYCCKFVVIESSFSLPCLVHFCQQPGIAFVFNLAVY